MLDPTSLWAWESHVDQRRVRADVLVVTLGSFMDAGHAQRLVNAHLRDTLPNHIIGRFDTDQLHDYAGRRPAVVFDRDHFEGYARPEMALRHVTDADGAGFLLLSGPEPSLQWERVAKTVEHVIEQVGIERTIIVQSMPSPTPHTRPVAVSQFASDPDLLVDHRPHLGTFQISASFNAVLTLRLGEAGREVLGLVAHVPHYLADNDYAPGAIAALASLERITGLSLPTDALRAVAATTLEAVDAQVADSQELVDMVGQLEQAYDAFMAEQRRLSEAETDLPTPEEIGAQVEDFLRTLGDEPTAS